MTWPRARLGVLIVVLVFNSEEMSAARAMVSSTLFAEKSVKR